MADADLSPSSTYGGLDAPPRWNLDQLYAGPTDPGLARDLERAGVLAQSARTRAVLAFELARAVAELEEFETLLARLEGYAELLVAQGDDEKGRYLVRKTEGLRGVARAVSDTVAKAPAASLTQPGLKARGAWVARVRRATPDPQEGSDPAVRAQRLRDLAEAHAALIDANREDLGGLSLEQARADLVRRGPHEGRALADRLDAALADVADAATSVYSVFLALLIEEARERGFDDPVHARFAHDGVSSDTVALALAAARSAGGQAAARLYRLKAQRFGLDVLPHWARRSAAADEAAPAIGWAKALRAARTGLASLSPEAGAQVDKALHAQRIALTVGEGGAFSHPVDGRPFVRAPYGGAAGHALALAHELGHAVHQSFAWAAQGPLLADAQAPLAETAASLSEAAATPELMRGLDADQRLGLTRLRLEDLLNAVVRQAAVHAFEVEAMRLRQEGPLEAEALAHAWSRAHAGIFGPAVSAGATFGRWWILARHLAVAPLYVYAYPLAEGAAAAMTACVPPGQGRAEPYLTFWESGAALTFDEALTAFGAGLHAGADWRAAFGVALDGMVDAYDDLTRRR